MSNAPVRKKGLELFLDSTASSFELLLDVAASSESGACSRPAQIKIKTGFGFGRLEAS